MNYSADERTAARVIASLIYPDFPNGPDLETHVNGLYGPAVNTCRDPYEMATITMVQDGKLRDCHGDAATAWEGLRQMSGAATPYAKLDPLIRSIGGAITPYTNGKPPVISTPPNVNPHTGEISEAPAAPDTSWLQHGVTLADLQHKPFDPETWVVEDILPEGACLLAAKYKSKKSWLALAIGLPIALGGKALGRMPVAQGRVLYLDLEGKQQRIKKRTRAILGVQNRPWPDNFHVYTTWPQGNEGMDRLEQWFRIYPDTRLVVIDVLSDFRRPMDKYEQPYQYDRATVTPLNQLFERYHAAGLLVHHFNKAKNDDIMDGISGTTGLPSAVNTMWGLSRDVNNSAITILNLRGRDLERDDPIALKWDSYLNIHVIEGPAIEVSRSGEQRAILTALSDTEPRTPQEITTITGKPVESVKFLLRKLLNDGLVDKPSYGKYIRIVATAAYGATLTHDATAAHSSIKSEAKSERVSGDLYQTHSSAHSVLDDRNHVNGVPDEESERRELDVDNDELDRILGPLA